MESFDKKSSKRTHRTVTRGELRCLIEDVYPSAGSLSKKDRTGNASQVKRGLLERSIPHKGRIRTTRIELEPTEAHALSALRENIRDIIKDLCELKRVRRHLGCSKPFPFYFENAVYFIVNSVASDAAWKTKNYTDCKRLLPDHLCFGNSVEEDLRSALVAERTKTDEEETPEAPEPPCVPAPERVRVDKIIARAEKKSDQAERIAYLTRSLSRHATDFRLLLCLYEEQWLAKDDWTPTFAKILSLTPKTAEEWSIRGMALEHQFRMDDAMEAHQNALKLEPGSIDALLGTIEIHRYRGEREDALTALRKALALIYDKKERVPILALYAVELQFNGQASQADRQLEEARASDPNSPDILWASAWRHLHAHDYDTAETMFRNLMQREHLGMWFLSACQGLLRCLMNAEQYDQAAHYARKVLEGAPQNALFRGILSWSLFKIGNLNEAKAQAERAITDAPNISFAYNALGAVYFKQGDFIRAEAHFRRMIELAPKGEYTPWAWQNIGAIREKEGQLDRALEAYRTGLELDPGCTSIRCNLAALYLGQGELDESERQCRYVLDSPSPSEDRRKAYVLLAATLHRQEKLHEVLECASAAPPEIRGEPELLKCEASAKQLLGDHPGAISLYERINWSETPSAYSQTQYLNALLHTRQYGKVVRLGREFMDSGLRHPVLGVVLGTAHRARHEYFEAIEFLALATQETPDDDSAKRELCLAYIELGLYEPIAVTDAVTFFEVLGKESPCVAGLLLGMAANHIRNQQYPAAQHHLNDAEIESPLLAKFLRVMAFSDALEMAQSESERREVIPLIRPGLWSSVSLGLVVYGSGEGSLETELERLDHTDDRDKLALVESASGHIRGWRPLEAVPALAALCERYPDASARRLLAFCLRMAGNDEHALRLLKKASHLDPSNVFGNIVSASIHAAIGAPDTAKTLYRSAASLAEEDFCKNACELAALLTEEDEDGASGKLVETVASIPNDQRVLQRFVQGHVNSASEPGWAIAALATTIACHRFPEDPEFPFQLGRAYNRIGMMRKRQECWRKAASLCESRVDETDPHWLGNVRDRLADYEQWRA
jgi:tetratricopeptide (TPR) repeat protein